MLIGNVFATFEIEGRGVVVICDVDYEHLPRGLKVHIGDSVDLRSGGNVVLRTRIAGIEHCDPWSPQQHFAFLLPPDLSKSVVPIGSQVWSAGDADSDAAPTGGCGTFEG